MSMKGKNEILTSHISVNKIKCISRLGVICILRHVLGDREEDFVKVQTKEFLMGDGIAKVVF